MGLMVRPPFVHINACVSPLLSSRHCLSACSDGTLQDDRDPLIVAASSKCAGAVEGIQAVDAVTAGLLSEDCVRPWCASK